MEIDPPRSKKRPRVESVKNTDPPLGEKCDNDDALFHYYKSRAEHTLQLANEQLKLEQKLDEEELDPTSLCWENVKSDKNRCLILTGFSPEEFMELLNLCEQSIPITLGRGKQSKYKPADKFLVVLCYVKHYETQAKLGETFKMSKAQANKIITTTVVSIVPILYEKLVIGVPYDITVYEQFPDGKYVLDVQSRRSGNH